MERRKFTIGLGALATGSAAAMGTGAFSQATAQREFALNVTPDDDGAYLGFSTESEYASIDGGNLSLEFDGSNDQEGSGVTSRANTVFEDVFTIENNGTQEIYVFLPGEADDTAGGSVQFLVDEGEAEFEGEHAEGYQNGEVTDVDSVDISHDPEAAGSDVSDKASNPIPQVSDTGEPEDDYVGLRYPGGSAVIPSGQSVDVDVRFTISGSRDEEDPFDKDFLITASDTAPTTADWDIGGWDL